jgi:UDP-N-acetylmuramate dehydrogenase
VYDKQALVIVNYGDASGPEILNFSEEIRKSVRYRFEVELEREVEVIGSI